MQQIKFYPSLLAPLLLGVVFFAFNSVYSYNFYHVNSFKIAFMGFLMIFLFVIYDLLFVGYKKVWKHENISAFRFPWTEAVLYLLPTLATFPGLFIHLGEHVNYNFRYELTIRLVILLWLVYVIRFLKLGKDLNRNILSFIIFIGAVMFYVWFFGVLESYGFAFNPIENWKHSVFAKSGGVARIKVTYGNINYLAGSLVSVLPMFLVLSIPDLKYKTEKQTDRFFFKKRLLHILFLAFFLATFHALFLTVTRAAIAASVLSNLAVLSVLAWSFVAQKRKIVSGFLVLSVFITIIVLFITLSFFYRDVLVTHSRFFAVFYPDVWGGRFIAWGAAIQGFLNAPFFGYGMGSSYGVFFRFIDPASRNFWVQRSYNHAHSEWIEYLAEGGIFGYICFFILWGYVFYHLIKIFLSPQASSFHKRLVLGCGGGMLGFYLHGFFSVSQRQIVTHLPQFAMLAIAFVLIAFYKDKLTVESSVEKKNILQKLIQKWQTRWNCFLHYLEKYPFLKNQLPCFLIITIGVMIYYPWAKGQKEFIKISKKGQNYLNTLQLEKLTEKYEDIYALDQLLRWQIRYRRYDKALKTIDKIEKTLPHYRITDFLKADIHFRQKKFKEAFEFTQTYSKQDNYFLPNLSLNNKLAIAFNKPDVYLQNLNYIAQMNNPVWNPNLRRKSREFYQFQFIIDNRQKNNISIRERKDEKNAIEIFFSANFFFKDFFPLALEIERTQNKKKRQQLASRLISRFNFELFKTALNCQFQKEDTGDKSKFFCKGGFIKIDPVDSSPENANKVLPFLSGVFQQLDPNLKDSENEAIFKNWGHIKGRVLFLKQIVKNYRIVLLL